MLNNTKLANGFTLIELMITVAIIGILASIAYPSYQSYVAKATRADALAALVKVANLQEQYYLDNKTYTEDMTRLGLGTSANSYVTERGDYSVSAKIAGDKVTITATAIGIQAKRDAACTPLTLDSIGVKTKNECW